MFENKVVAITGGANGIGKCIAEEFQKNGAKICVIDKAEGEHFVGDISDKAVLLKLRDNGKIFNPTEYRDDSGKSITGLEMVRAIASSVEYNRVIGYNTTVVNIDLVR